MFPAAGIAAVAVAAAKNVLSLADAAAAVSAEVVKAPTDAFETEVKHGQGPAHPARPLRHAVS